MRKLTTVLGLVLILALGLVATVVRPEPARAATGDNLVLVWNDETLEAIRKLPPAPTVAARALAIVHTAIYDAWAAYDPLAVGTRLGAGLRQPEAERTPANKDKAVSFAAYTALMDLFPAAPVTLSWKSFTAAADQAGISREYGGIHFNDGDYEDRQAGELVGLQVWSKAKSYFNGKAIPKT